MKYEICTSQFAIMKPFVGMRVKANMGRWTHERGCMGGNFRSDFLKRFPLVHLA